METVDGYITHNSGDGDSAEVDQARGGMSNLDERLDTIELTALSDKAETTTKFTDIALFAYNYKLPNVTDWEQAIMDAVNDADVKGIRKVILPSGPITIGNPVIVGHTVEIVGTKGTVVTNNGIGDAFVLGVSYGIKLKDIFIVGNINSKSGVVISSSYCELENVHCNNNGEYGIEVTPDTFAVNINKCETYNNQKSGIYAVSSGGAGQVNNINISATVSKENGEHGVYVTGTSININNGCDIEGNAKAGVFVSTQTANVLGINIKDNYIESNKDGNIVFDLYPAIGNLLYNASITGNFLNLYASVINIGAANIKAITDTVGNGIASLIVDNTNNFYTDTVPHVDLGDAVSTTSTERSFAVVETGKIGDTADYSTFYKNLGGAVLSPYQKTDVILGMIFAKGIPYTYGDKSDNILSEISSKYAFYPMFLKTGAQFKKAGVYITTNSSNYGVQFSLIKANAITGAVSSVGGETLALLNGNGFVSMSDISSITPPKSVKLGANESLYLQLQFTNNDVGTSSFQVGNPVITYYA